jgi:hypothetical protein
MKVDFMRDLKQAFRLRKLPSEKHYLSKGPYGLQIFLANITVIVTKICLLSQGLQQLMRDISSLSHYLLRDE